MRRMVLVLIISFLMTPLAYPQVYQEPLPPERLESEIAQDQTCSTYEMKMALYYKIIAEKRGVRMEDMERTINDMDTILNRMQMNTNTIVKELERVTRWKNILKGTTVTLAASTAILGTILILGSR